MPEVQIIISATDKASAVIQQTAGATKTLADAMTKLLVQERNNQIIQDAQAALSKMTDAEKQAALAAYDMGDSVQKAGLSLTDIKSGIDIARQAVQTFVGVFQKAMEIGEQGAGLEFAQRKFDRLAVSIGTTSDALEGKLKTATAGMVSDSALVSSAGDLMSLGLAKTSDQVVRLTKVSGALGMDMNQLVLTLANQTTMRFDQLGVSVDGFDQRLAQLKATGMDANAAFTEAFLQQAEAQLEKVGSQADTGAGQFAKLNTALQNFKDAGLKDLAPGLTSAASAMTILLTATDQVHGALLQHGDQVVDTSRSYGEYIAEMQRSYAAAGMSVQVTEDGTRVFERHGQRMADVTDKFHILTQAEYEEAHAKQLAEKVAASHAMQVSEEEKRIAKYNSTVVDSGQAQQQYSTAILQVQAAQDKVRTSTIHMSDAAIQASSQYKNLRAAVDGLASAQANFNQSFGDKAAAALEAAGVKGERYASALGVIDQTQGTQLKAQYDAQQSMQKLAQDYASGKISLEQYKQGLEGQKPAWEALDQNMQKAKESLEAAHMAFNNFIASVAGADGMSINIYVNSMAGGGSGSWHPGNKGVQGPGTQNRGTENYSTGQGAYGTAGGGFRQKGDFLLVGEEGPEMGVLPQDTYFYNAAQTRQIMTNITPVSNDYSSSPMTNNFFIYDITDWEAAAARITRIQQRGRK